MDDKEAVWGFAIWLAENFHSQDIKLENHIVGSALLLLSVISSQNRGVDSDDAVRYAAKTIESLYSDREEVDRVLRGSKATEN